MSEKIRPRPASGWTTVVLLAVAALVPASGVDGRKNETPATGLIAVSAGDSVIVVHPATGDTRSIPTGPVAWLFPAPGSTLFAPDLVNGRTTVIDLATQTVSDTLDGVTMPHFGDRTDRYIVVSKQVLVVSYPERALIGRMDIEIKNPWQTEVLAGNTVLIVLEREPEGGSETSLTAVNLSDGRLVYRRPLAAGVRHFAISPQLGVIALANASANGVVLADPAALAPRATFAMNGSPVDLSFVGDGTTLAVATQSAGGRGSVALWKLKQDKKGRLTRKKEWHVELEGSPVRLAASPDGRYLAAGLASGLLQIVKVESQTVVQSAMMNGTPRDVVWCDLMTPGPILPEWSDDDPPTLDLGG